LTNVEIVAVFLLEFADCICLCWCSYLYILQCGVQIYRRTYRYRSAGKKAEN